MTAQEQEFEEALAYIQSCDYKGTHVKVELEAELGRENGQEEECSGCEGNGEVRCDRCDSGEGELSPGVFDTCDTCGGNGMVFCHYCDGSGHSEEDMRWDESDCDDFIRDAVSPEAREALVFSMFYDDGSVDSEFTFTLPLGKAKYVLEFIRAFKKLAETIDNEFDTSGAGMHIAILNSVDGNYPRGNSLDTVRAENFARSMNPLMPALYFLASPNQESRGLGYRHPRVNLYEKYAAVSGENDCFEYRVFETCYQQPESFLDYMIVISRSLRFYTRDYVNTSMKLGSLGFKSSGYDLERFYYTTKHITALNKGLKWLRPTYKQVKELKAERAFKLTPAQLKKKDKELREGWVKEYADVKDRLRAERKQARQRLIVDYENYVLRNHPAVVEQELGTQKQYVERSLKNEYGHLYGGVRKYVRNKLREQNRTDYTVTC